MFCILLDPAYSNIQIGLCSAAANEKKKGDGTKKNVVLAKLAALIFDVEEEGPEIRSRFQKHVPKHMASLNHYLIKYSFVELCHHFSTLIFHLHRCQKSYHDNRGHLGKRTGEGLTAEESLRSDNLLGKCKASHYVYQHVSFQLRRGTSPGISLVG
jgi:hypothetical protein